MDRRLALVPLAVLVLAGCTGDGEDDSAGAAATTATAAPGEVEWGACGFDVPAGVDIECGTLEVLADRDDPGAGTVSLAFGVVPAAAEDPAEEPLVYLSGGPGQGALEIVPLAFGELYEPLAQERDLILLDQRGTGLTEPSLACEEYSSWVRESLGSDEPVEELAAQATAALEECRQRLVDEGVDFDDYDSAASAADLEDLRRALGHEEWDLYGISYGTRLAQTAMRDHPEGIRAVVLDASYPIDADLYEETPGNAARALEGLFAACAADAGCAEQHPDLAQTVTDLVAELDAEPATVTVLDPTTGERVEAPLDGAGLVGFLFQSMYSTELIPFLPEVVEAAANDDFGTIGLLLGAFAQQLDLVSVGQQLAVQCEEEVSFSDQEVVAAAAAEHPLVESFFANAPTMGPAVFDVCADWDAGQPGPAENEALTSDIPTLVLAGELDPITPPRWGAQLAEDLGNSVFVEFPSTGHGSVGTHECAVQLTRDFLADPDSEPDASCVDDVELPAFTPEGVEVEMTAWESEELGIAGLRPEGWSEVLPGAFQQSPLVSLVQQVVPGATADQVLQQVAAQLGTGEPLEPVDQRETGSATWDLYRLDDLGQRIDLALAETPAGLAVVQLATSPARSDVYREQVFDPAVAAFDPGA
ncbi:MULTISPECIES: alpha/beta hydrolase [unclassified Modestobacter]|uniref:alpha/beta hydrolase n=1 Tax=unclassified Modestobacter TaxID=2643866 RepID=UPI0022AA6FDB|nr:MULTISPECIES: alpha/beta hydrolase [unclassified Modestobacter]MCZ2825727.1 alpha/beta hydrolase [Modestobacter sp. VKM Ac-2981]MCZ2853208.1 alpha/beta hydrolase [Modestobacter sp. VKM Ac-2982]